MNANSWNGSYKDEVPTSQWWLSISLVQALQELRATLLPVLPVHTERQESIILDSG